MSTGALGLIGAARHAMQSASRADVLRTSRHVPRARCKSDAARYFRNLLITSWAVFSGLGLDFSCSDVEIEN